MDFKVNREIFSTKEVVYEGSNEQAVELDYILPDYFPEVFRVLKCQLTPRIVSQSMNGEKLCYELVVGIRVLYMSENSDTLQSIEQKLNYSKAVDMPKAADKPSVLLTPKCDYINCRVVNSRRLDFRGAVSTKVKATAEKKQQIVTDAFGGNIQLKKETISCPVSRMCATKRATVIEELEMGSVKPAVMSIVRSDATVMQHDEKVVANKLIVSGEANISMLYTCDNDNSSSLETMQFTVPFSQVVDVDGITDKCNINCTVTVVSCEVIPRGNTGETTEVECELVLEIVCEACRYENVDVVTDAFSTTNPVKMEYADAKIEKVPTQVHESQQVKANMEYNDGELESVYDAWAKVNNVSCRCNMDTKTVVYSGSCNFVVMAKSTDGKPVYMESDVPFEHTMKVDEMSESNYAEPTAEVATTSYNMMNTNVVEAKADVRIGGIVNDTVSCKIMSGLEVDENEMKQKEGDYALKLYFADEGEDVWEIAKKYSTSMDAILEENDLMGESKVKKGMVLIPMKN